jgi:hypothetical protein
MKIGMVLVSLIAYSPIAFSVGNIAESITVSQSHVNKNKTIRGTANIFDTMSNITYTHNMRPNIDALQAILTLNNEGAFADVVQKSFSLFDVAPGGTEPQPLLG